MLGQGYGNQQNHVFLVQSGAPASPLDEIQKPTENRRIVVEISKKFWTSLEKVGMY